MLTLGIIVIVLWLIVMGILLTPQGTYASAWDRLTKARSRDDRVPLQIMLDHLRSRPEEWSVSRDSAAFPLTGAKQIYLTKSDKGWEYNLSNFGTKSRPLNGYFEKHFVDALTEENSRRESQSLLRALYPNLDGPLLIGNK